MSGAPVLVLNAGSATLKATVLDLPEPAPRLERTVDWSAAAPAAERRAAIDSVLDAAAGAGIGTDTFTAVAHRVVHGGERFTSPAIIDDEVVDALSGLVDLAPLHNPLAIATIRAARERLPELPHVAAFDTAFHASLPAAARTYALPGEWNDRWQLRRYGFHGLSHAYATRRAEALLGGTSPGRRIVLLTVFVKTRMRESAEVERARRAMARCLAQEHGVEDDGG